MATAAGWSTVEALSAAMGITNPSSADSGNLVAIANGLKAEFESYIGRTVLKADAGTVTEFFDGGAKVLPLAVSPIEAIISVRIAHNSLRKFDDGNSTLLTADEYSVSAGGEMLNLLAVPAVGERGVQVVYTGGFATLPADMDRVWRAEVRTEWIRRFAPHVANISSAGGNLQVETPFGLSPETKRVLWRYRVACPIVN
jgi:hypothetical protein